jgi:shikimate 5-dehydrogenase
LTTAARSHAAKVYVTNRSPERAELLASRMPGVIVVPWEDRQTAAAACDLVVNTTPSGLVNDSSPLRDLSPRDGGARTRFFYDLVYRPDLTPLQRQAAEAGMPFVDGLAHLEAHATVMLPMIGLSLSRKEVRALVVAATGRTPRSWDLLSSS